MIFYLRQMTDEKPCVKSFVSCGKPGCLQRTGAHEFLGQLPAGLRVGRPARKLNGRSRIFVVFSDLRRRVSRNFAAPLPYHAGMSATRSPSLVVIVLLLLSSARTLGAGPVVADCGAAIRKTDGRIDIPATVAALKKMSANTYLYATWENENDFSDLPAFADTAAKEKIQVWVYLLPWSLTAPDRPRGPSPKPYGNDYVAWARAIGRQSVEHPNITGYVMDDFYENVSSGRFDEDVVKAMVDTGKKYNPKLRFFPIVYFQQPWAEFVKRFNKFVDGALVCYPKSMTQIENAARYLRDERHGTAVLFRMGARQRVEGGTVATATTLISGSGAHTLLFYLDDQTTPLGLTKIDPNDPSAHTVFVEVNGREVWAKTIRQSAGNTEGVMTVKLPASAEKKNSTLRIGVRFNASGAEGESLQIRFDDIRVLSDAKRGLGRFKELKSEWIVKGTGVLHPEVEQAAERYGRFSLPMIILLATDPQQHEKRYNEPGTPDNIARKLQLAADAVNQGLAWGFAAWWTPIGPDSKVAPEVSKAARTLAPGRAQ